MSGIIMKNGIPYGNGDNTITCTQAEYDAWEQAGTLQENVTYYITDAPADTAIRDTLISTDTTWSSTKIINMIYPVGSIFISVSNVNPSTYFTGTSWEAFGSGKTLVGVDTTDTDFNTVAKTGGKKDVTLTSAQSGQKNLGSITSADNNRGHTHKYDKVNTPTGGTSLPNTALSDRTCIEIPAQSAGTRSGIAWGTLNVTKNQWYVTSTYDASQAGDITGVYQTHTHTIGTTSTNSGAESQSHTHTVTISGSDATSAHTNLQPYITTYMWKRVS